MVATFFGGAMNKITPEYHASVAIGEILAEKGYTVKNGGYGGLMKAVSLGVKNKGGVTFGYTCKTFPSTIGNEYLTYTIVADDIYDRLRYLLEADIFIIQKGGIGAISEVMLLLDISRKMKEKPTIYVFCLFIYDLIERIKNEIPDNYPKIVFLNAPIQLNDLI